MMRLLPLAAILDALKLRRSVSGVPADRLPAVLEAVERVVEGTEPSIRSVYGYRKKLQEPVAAALAYLDGLVEQLPAPVTFSSDAFVSDPQVNALFANVDELHAVFAQSSELQAFFQAVEHADLEVGHALLCVRMERKTVLGAELANGNVQREVLQSAINFSDHKILSPAATAAAVRQGIKTCMFEGLITYALQHIVAIRTEQRGIDDEIRILNARLRARKAKGGELAALLSSAFNGEVSTGDVEQALVEARRKREQLPARLDTPHDMLAEVRRVVSGPDAFIRFRCVPLTLNKMGIVVGEDYKDASNRIQVAELEIAGVLKRVVTLVRYPRDEMD